MKNNYKNWLSIKNIWDANGMDNYPIIIGVQNIESPVSHRLTDIYKTQQTILHYYIKYYLYQCLKNVTSPEPGCSCCDASL